MIEYVDHTEFDRVWDSLPAAERFTDPSLTREINLWDWQRQAWIAVRAQS